MLLWQTEPHFKDQLRPEICCEVKLFLHMADWHVARTFCSSRVKFSSLRCAWKYCIQVNDLTWIGQCWYQIGSICSAQHQWCLCLLENTAVNLISLQIMSNECVGVSCILANVSEHETVLFILWGLIVQKWANTKVNSPLNTSGKVLELLCSRQAMFPLLTLTSSVCHRPLLFFFFTTFTEFQWLWEIAVRSLLLPSLVISCQDTPVLNCCCCFHFTNCDWLRGRFWLIFTPLKMLLWAKCRPEMYSYVSLFHKRFVSVWFLYIPPPPAFLLLPLSLQKQN